MQAAQKGDLAVVSLLLRAPQKVTEPCITRSLSVAANNGWLPVVLCLVQAGANCDNENAAALMHAAQMGNVGIATAIVMGRTPPSPVSLNRILDHVLSLSAEFINGNLELIEVLLCGGPSGNATNEGLIKATMLANAEMVQLLLAHNADINYNGATAIAHAICQNRGDLLGLLLQGQKLKPELAAELVGLVPAAASSTDKVTILSKLLVNGASGRRCSELLVFAAERDDLDTAKLLITARDHMGRPVCSVDYDSARSLKLAVAKGYVPMLKILLDGAPSKSSLSAVFSSVPTSLGREIHFSLVQTLLGAGAEGPAIDEALVSAVGDEPKSLELIELLVRNGAVVADQTLYAIVPQGLLNILDILLMGKVSARSCSIAIPMAMKLRNPQSRYHTIRLLLGQSTKSDSGSPEVTQAIIELLQHYPEDKSLLLLLCRDGKANINLLEGLAVELATRNGDLEAFNIVIGECGTSPNSTSVERALRCALELQLSDSNRKEKVKFLLHHAKPANAINEALVMEIKLVLESSRHELSVIQILLAAGADINAIDGAAVVWGIRDPAITDLLLPKKLSSQSFSKAFLYATSLNGRARYSLYEKLVRAKAPKDTVSIALSTVIKEGQSAIPIIELLLPQADVNFNDGQAMLVAVQQVFVEGLDILLTPRDIMPSTATKSSAFQTAMQLKNTPSRYAIAIRLLKSGIPMNIISDALVVAVNTSDIRLSEALLRSGACIEHLRGQAVLCAASSGQGDILRLLIEGRLCDKPSMSTFISAFGGAMTLKQKDPRSCRLIVQILLEAGVRGDAVNAALVEIARDGDVNFEISELLCKIGEASVEWNEGEALNIAAQSSSIQTLSLLLQQRPSQGVLTRAYKSACYLSKDSCYQVVELLLRAGKSIDNQVSGSLTSATKEAPPNRRLIRLLLDNDAFDEGESITNSARALDTETLKLLLGSPKASTHIPSSFKDVIATGFNRQSHEGLSIVKLLLEGGASGDIVGEALSSAVKDLKDFPGQLANEFVDILLRYGADVNYQRGLPLQRVAAQVNIDIVEKFLPSATTESKAMSIPYLFKACDEPTTLVRAIQTFSDSLDGDDKLFITGFTHPDSLLLPVLFMALERCPKRHQVLKALLDLGYDPNQWIPRGISPTLASEPWPILCWAIEQPEKGVSNMNIELLIDAGGEFALYCLQVLC
jgi:ankyrin repeat protein